MTSFTLSGIEIFYNLVFKKEESFNQDKCIPYLEPKIGINLAKQCTFKIQEFINHMPNFESEIKVGLRPLEEINELKNKVLMYSLSETYDNDNQWSNYAEDGHGYCIGYKIDIFDPKFETFAYDLVPIYYGMKEELNLPKMIAELFRFNLNKEIKEISEIEKIFISLYTKNGNGMVNKNGALAFQRVKPI